ncbi:Peroxisomal membrane protein PAS20 [Podochytrium sp. JEL0797]|nr:Peroxisomal membrane protein PAS20 [Podochytrium sp. JEL0797]
MGVNRPGYGTSALGGGYGTGMGMGGIGGAYGSSMYDQSGGYGAGESYGGGMNRFSRFGAGGMGGYGMNSYGGGGYGGYGGGGMYGGGYGAGGYGMNGMMGRPPYDPNNPNAMPLSAQIEQSTQHAFQSIDQVVQAFMGFSQMLESTFFATHSSFMAMVGVAEQLGNLRSYLGGVVSAIALTDSIKRWLYHLLGKPMPVDPKSLTAEGFEKFAGTGGGPNGAPGQPKTSKRPVFLFLAFMVGFPWLMSKVIQRLQKKQLELAAAAAAADPTGMMAGGVPLLGPDGMPLQASQIRGLEFCKGVFDFVASSPHELSFKKGDVIAILSKVDAVTREPSLWWRGRLRTGEVGFFPANYVDVIEKKKELAIGAPPGEGVGTPVDGVSGVMNGVAGDGAAAVGSVAMPGVFPSNVQFKKA